MNYRKLRQFCVKSFVSLLFILILTRWVDWQETIQTISTVSIGYLLFSYVIMVLTEAVIAIRLWFFMKPTPLQLTVIRLFKIGFMTLFYALFLPAGIGIGIARWVKVTENNTGRMHFLVVTVIEKGMILFCTLVVAGIPLLCSNDQRISALRAAFAPIFYTAISGLMVMFAFTFFGAVNQHAMNLFESFKRDGKKRLNKMLQTMSSLGAFSGNHRLFLTTMTLSICIQGMIVVRIVLLFRAVGVELPLSTELWVASLVFLIQALPISVAGLGVRESSFAFVFSLFEKQPEAGALVGILFFVQVLASAGIGGLLELADRGNPTGRGPVENQRKETSCRLPMS
jgi:uncharacterized protein (TIRG00374 family)